MCPRVFFFFLVPIYQKNLGHHHQNSFSSLWPRLFLLYRGKEKKCRSVDLFKKRRELVGLIAKKYKTNMNNKFRHWK